MDFIDLFHKHYYKNNVWAEGNTTWLGVPTLKCPLDLWILQEILYETRPDWIIECGTNQGGSSLFLASVCDLMDHGKVITIDIADYNIQKIHPRIRYLIGSSTSDEIIEEVKRTITKEDSVMVILDSDHSKNHVLKELEIYHSFVTKGNYLIVEDTNINGHPVLPEFGDGPMEALEEFLSTNDEFIIDQSREKFFLTFNPKGFLKKIK
jgi:cephalosporin hydroxylase